MRLYFLILILALTFSCKNETGNALKPNLNTNCKTPKSSVGTLPVFCYEVVNTFKHDPKAFTQGLAYFDGFLYESTGHYERSTLRKVELETGKVLQKYDLPGTVFAEGMTIFNGKIYQISWREGLAWQYNLEDFKMIKEFRYAGDGWGLTNDGTNLFMSDGTHIIRVVNPENFETIRTIPVLREDGLELNNINELEWVKGEIWANIWHSEKINLPNRIARIDPNTGKLLGWINLDGISPEDVARDPENTLNGIAYDEKTNRIFVTGKNWKNLFEIKLKEQ